MTVLYTFILDYDDGFNDSLSLHHGWYIFYIVCSFYC